MHSPVIERGASVYRAGVLFGSPGFDSLSVLTFAISNNVCIM